MVKRICRQLNALAWRQRQYADTARLCAFRKSVQQVGLYVVIRRIAQYDVEHRVRVRGEPRIEGNPELRSEAPPGHFHRCRIVKRMRGQPRVERQPVADAKVERRQVGGCEGGASAQAGQPLNKSACVVGRAGHRQGTLFTFPAGA